MQKYLKSARATDATRFKATENKVGHVSDHRSITIMVIIRNSDWRRQITLFSHEKLFNEFISPPNYKSHLAPLTHSPHTQLTRKVSNIKKVRTTAEFEICDSLKFVFYKLFANSATRWIFLWSKIFLNISKSYQIFIENLYRFCKIWNDFAT